MIRAFFSGNANKELRSLVNRVSSQTPRIRYSSTSQVDVSISASDEKSRIHESVAKSHKSFSDIPGPKGLPVIGTLWDYMKKDGLKFNKLFEVMQQRAIEYGPIYKEKIGHQTFVVISDPKEYMNVIRVDGKYPNRREVDPMVKYLKKRGMTLGLVNSQGEEWYRPRVKISKKLLRPKELADYIQPMNDVAEDFVERLRRLSSLSLASTVPDLEMELFKWSLESVGTVVFEERIGCLSDPPPPLAEEFIVVLGKIMKYIQLLMFGAPLYKIYPTKTWKMFENAVDNSYRLGHTFINKKLASMQRTEVSGKDTAEKSAFLTFLVTNFSPDDALFHAMDVMGAAVETTSTTVLWMLYLLARNPASQNALYMDIKNGLNDHGTVTEENLQRMQYAKACLRETFRLYPVASSTTRRIATDISVCGYHIPKGTLCQSNLYAIGRDKNVYDDPLSYKPERWLRDNKEEMLLPNLAFGHGPRMCIGRRLAKQEIYLLLIKIIQNFRLDYHETPVNPIQHLFIAPDRPLKIKFIPRH